MNKFENIIEKLLVKHKEGETFFDNLDAELRHNENHDIINSLMAGLENCNIVVSGKFGRYLCSLYPNLLLFNGSLRSKDGLAAVMGEDTTKSYTNYIFIDDSFYSGTTRDKINNVLARKNSKIVKTLVAYDGSKHKDDTVFSLFRYHK